MLLQCRYVSVIVDVSRSYHHFANESLRWLFGTIYLSPNPSSLSCCFFHGVIDSKLHSGKFKTFSYVLLFRGMILGSQQEGLAGMRFATAR